MLSAHVQLMWRSGSSEVAPLQRRRPPPAQLNSLINSSSHLYFPFFCVNKQRCGSECEGTGVSVGSRCEYEVRLSRFVPLEQRPGSFPEKIHRNPFDAPQSPKNKHTQCEKRKSIAFRSLISSQSDFISPLFIFPSPSRGGPELQSEFGRFI